MRETGIAMLSRFFHPPSLAGTILMLPKPGKAEEVVAAPLVRLSALPTGAAGLGQPPSL